MSLKKIYEQSFRHAGRVRLAALIIVAAGALTACGQGAASSMADYIGIDAAKEAALKAADISADQATLLSAGLDSKDGTFYYQVVFQESGVEYEYDIDALTGVVIEEKQTSLQDEYPADTVKYPNTDGETKGTALQGIADSGPAVSNEAAAGAGIDSDTAYSLALSHAGLTEADITFHKVKEDWEDGKRVYDVEFMASNGTEYDYEMSAEDGTVLKYDAEFQFLNTPAADTGIISEDQVKQTVLERVPGALAENVMIHLEEDDGRMEYEGKLFYDNVKYEFKIDAYSGGLMEWEAESAFN